MTGVVAPLQPPADGQRQPPRGVPRWLWPPPGAEVAVFRVREATDGIAAPAYSAPGGEPLPLEHLRALRWLLDEFDRTPLPAGVPSEIEVVVAVARTDLGGGRIGTAYAMDGGPLGAPSAGRARGAVWRYLMERLPR